MNLHEVKSLAIQLLDQHKLLDDKWHFAFDKAKRRLGVCDYRRKTIALSAYFAIDNDVDKVKDVILHEIAHALAGPKAGHGPEWVRIAKMIGCDGLRCSSNHVQETVLTKARYKAVCPGCSKVYYFFKRKRRDGSCGVCSGGVYNHNYLLKLESI